MLEHPLMQKKKTNKMKIMGNEEGIFIQVDLEVKLTVLNAPIC